MRRLGVSGAPVGKKGQHSAFVSLLRAPKPPPELQGPAVLQVCSHEGRSLGSSQGRGLGWLRLAQTSPAAQVWCPVVQAPHPHPEFSRLSCTLL